MVIPCLQLNSGVRQQNLHPLKPQIRVILFVSVCTMANLNCNESSRDDRFARSFINLVYQRDTSVFSQLEPRSLLREFAAKRLAALLDSLPPPPVSLRLVEHQMVYGMDAAPEVSRQLTYLLKGGSRETRVDLRLVSESGRTYVDAVWATQPALAH